MKIRLDPVIPYGTPWENLGRFSCSFTTAEPRAFRDNLVEERGLPMWRAEELAFIASAYGEGAGKLVADVVRRVGGSEPRSFAQFVREHADHFASGLSHHM